jgi:phosphate transport system protein
MTSRIRFNEELAALNSEIIQMGELAQKMVKEGVQAFLNGDSALRAEVARLDKDIYRQEQLIEKHCVDVIALHQPVAGDLRTVSTCLKIITDLNRIGRYGRDIAELSDIHDQDRSFKRVVAIPLMSELVISMVSDSIGSFVARDDKTARHLFDRDDQVDSLWDTIFRESLTYMIEDPRNITAGTHFILVARYLERIADHSCNIGDRVVFMATGERLDPYERKRSHHNDNSDRPAKMTSTDGYYTISLDEK